MKAVYFLFCIIVLIVLIGCKKDPIKQMDFCPSCTSDIEVNGQNFDSKPINTFYKFGSNNDTSFIVEIQETESLNDDFRDVLLFWRIPFQVGIHKLTDSLNNASFTDILFHVYETAINIPAQLYSPDFSGESIINVTYLNKVTGEYKISFNVFLYSGGDINNPVNNNSYPNVIKFIGESEGKINP